MRLERGSSAWAGGGYGRREEGLERQSRIGIRPDGGSVGVASALFFFVFFVRFAFDIFFGD
jgi:hypothetical protein